MVTSSHRDLLRELFKQPGFRRNYLKNKVFNELLVQIINRRVKEGITQGKLAEKLGTHQSGISRMEKGIHNMRLDTIVEVADALNAWVNIELFPYKYFEDYVTLDFLQVEAQSPTIYKIPESAFIVEDELVA